MASLIHSIGVWCERRSLIRWPLADDNTGLEKFAQLLQSFSRLSDLYTRFWISQALAAMVIVIFIVLDAMDF